MGREGPCLADPVGHGVCVWGPQGHVEHNHSIHDNEDGHHQEEGQVPARIGWAGGGLTLWHCIPRYQPHPQGLLPPDPVREGLALEVVVGGQCPRREGEEVGSGREDWPYLLMSGTAWEVSGTFFATRKRKTVWAKSTLMATVHFWPPAADDQ